MMLCIQRLIESFVRLYTDGKTNAFTAGLYSGSGIFFGIDLTNNIDWDESFNDDIRISMENTITDHESALFYHDDVMTDDCKVKYILQITIQFFTKSTFYGTVLKNMVN